MGKQAVRQRARSQARQARTKVRQQQAQRERRLAKWAEQVAVALAERDALVTEHEQRAGQALRSMIEQDGLTTREAVTWCGAEGLTARAVYRLIRDAGKQQGDQECGQGDHAGQGSPGETEPGDPGLPRGRGDDVLRPQHNPPQGRTTPADAGSTRLRG
jgi:hypothetical protein